MTERNLYFISGSPPCWSVMLALEVKGLAYTPVRLSNTKGEQKDETFLKINPRGHVPVLQDGDATVTETLAVLAYLDKTEPEPALLGSTAEETGKIWQIISECNAHLRDQVGDISRPLFRGKEQAFVEKIKTAAEKVRSELALLEEKLSTSNWLVGDSLSAADLIVYPILMQLERAVSKPEAEPLGLDLCPFTEFYPKIADWIERIRAMPGHENAYPPHWK